MAKPISDAFSRAAHWTAAQCGRTHTFIAALLVVLAWAPYHRLAAHGNPEPRVLHYTTRMLLIAVGCLALGMVGDAYVTVSTIAGQPLFGLLAAIAVLAGFAVLLYVVPLRARRAKAAA